jgi:methyl-accepting chemotaxis protein
MTIQQNIADRQSAEQLYRQAGELLAPEVGKMTAGARLIFWRMMRDLVSRALQKADPTTKVVIGILNEAMKQHQPRKLRTREPSQDVKDALDLCLTIQEMAEEVPERGQDFANSVSSKAADIASTIEERDCVTEAQMSALENMYSGLERWVQ